MLPTIISSFKISIDTDRILQGQGIDPSKASSRIISIARKILPQALSLLGPAALYVCLPLQELQQHRVVLTEGIILEGSLPSRILAGASKVALAVCTIGPNLDAKVSKMLDSGNTVEALALDGAGIAAVEEVSRVLVDQINHAAGIEGLTTGTAISPGQEGWLLEQQRIIFKLLPAERIGVRLTESCVMLPRKSISFVLPIGPGLCTDKIHCDFCSKRERCSWSKIKR